MRELYAVHLDFTDSAAEVEQLVREWIARPASRECLVDELAVSGEYEEGNHRFDVHRVAIGDQPDAGWLCRWTSLNDQDPRFEWHRMMAIGRSTDADDAPVRFTLRIGLEQVGEADLTPPIYQFGSPAIVRTLLREHHLVDSIGVPLEPNPTVMLAAEVPSLVDWLTNRDRHLPIVVVTSGPGGSPLVDVWRLARELAGLAHVVQIGTHLANRRLTELVGQSRSVWSGAVRIYWPGFELGDQSARRHRYWLAREIERPEALIEAIRTVVAQRAAAAVPQHINWDRLRRAQREALLDHAGAAERTDWEAYAHEMAAALEQAQDELAKSEAEIDRHRKHTDELESRLLAAEDELRDARDEAAALREALIEYGREAARTGEVADEAVVLDWMNMTVLDAYESAKAEAGKHIQYLSGADKSIKKFTGYKNPQRLYQAMTAVNAAAQAWADGTLTSGFGDFFREIGGYDFDARNTAATARPTRAKYAVNFRGRTLRMEPHLKVDQSTSPDQCLRIYWAQFDENGEKVLAVGHVGEHLPEV